ncbi:MAG: hypothetical protein GVX96_03370 [Bacteroidetes bacterium]|jgi:hypothetical protein|nr:hypothetical protein [Bacteroidota bacterium]
MLGRLIKWALIIVIGLLVYNYFYGTEQEKKQSEEIFTKTKEIGQSIVGFVSDETQKVKDGKYNDVIDNISGFLSELKSEKNAEEIEEIQSDLDKTKENYESESTSADSLESQLQDILRRLEKMKEDS